MDQPARNGAPQSPTGNGTAQAIPGAVSILTTLAIKWREIEVDPALVRPAAGNRIVTPESVADLLPSMEKEGQIVPAIICPDPENPRFFLGLDGNRRGLCQRILGRKLRACLLESAPPEKEIIRIRAATNFHRKNASAYELAADIQRWKELEGGATQRQAAEAFGISASQVCKLLDKLEHACLEVREAEESKVICPDSARLIATLRSHGQQKEALKETIAHNLKRDAVERLVARMKGFTKKGKSKPVKIYVDGVTLLVPGDWTWQQIRDFVAKLKGAADRGEKMDAPLSLLPSLLKSA